MSNTPRTLPENFSNILVIRQHDQNGDMICAVPLLRVLRSAYPTARLTLMTSPVNCDIMQHHPFVNDIINYDKRSLWSSPVELWQFLRRFRAGKFDLAVVPATVSVSHTSNLLALLSGAKVRVGPASLEGKKNRASWCLTTRVALDWSNNPRAHQTRRNLDILSPLGLSTDDLTCTIGLTREEKNRAEAALSPLRKRHRILVGIHPGAGKIPNRWPPDRFAGVANRLSANYGAGIIITEGPMDDQPVREMLDSLECRYHIIKERSIRNAAAVIDQLDFYITNDTGVMHIAGATRPRLLSLFGPTDPLQWAPIGQKNRYVSVKDGNIMSLTLAEVDNIVDIIMREIQRDLKLL